MLPYVIGLAVTAIGASLLFEGRIEKRDDRQMKLDLKQDQREEEDDRVMMAR